MTERIHIVCLDAPSPPDYGGAIDMFYKVKALAQIGKKITLHYFDYRSSRNAKGLEADCEAIHLYRRKPFFRSLPVSKPFIVASRINHSLIERLNGDDHPVLLEGLHCAGLIPFLKHPARVVLRMHNDEAAYYRHLAQTEKNLFKRVYFLQESSLLQKYQLSLNKDLRLASLSLTDDEDFKSVYGFKQTSFVPCFIPWQKVSSKNGRGDYCLYHGNMSVSENEEAALWLIKNVFNQLPFKLLVAGKGISKKLIKTAAGQKNVQLVQNPTITEVDHLVQNAQINVLPSMNNTGVKLKLLNALLNGRHCITNYNGVKGSGIERGLTVAENSQQWIAQINTLMQSEFSGDEIAARMQVLQLYNNAESAKCLNALW